MINKGDTVRLRHTDIICTVIDVIGHHVTVKYNTLNLPAEVYLEEELEPIILDEIMIGCIRQNRGDVK